MSNRCHRPCPSEICIAPKPSSKYSRKMYNLARKKKSSNPEHRFSEFLSSEVLLSKCAAPSLRLPLQVLLVHEVSPTLAERDKRSWSTQPNSLQIMDIYNQRRLSDITGDGSSKAQQAIMWYTYPANNVAD